MGGMELFQYCNTNIQLNDTPPLNIDIDSPHFKLLEHFTVIMYDKTSELQCVNEARKDLLCHKGRMVENTQSHPEKLRGPGQRVKVGPQGQGGFHSESQLQPSCKSKTKRKKGHYVLTMTIAAPPNYISLFISFLHCYS